jgi:outer membrane receptor protein involved in Fe transport
MFVYDYELRAMVFGNSSLKLVDIDNYDLRLETYFKNGDNVSVSLFYKNFSNHIEVTDAPQGYTWENVDKSFVQGIEIEGRKVITPRLDVKANVTLVKSETSYMQRALLITNGEKEYQDVGRVKRTMFGQAPWVVNCMVNYNFEKVKMTATASYNVQGPRLVITAFDPNFEVYDQPRHLVDVKFVKQLGQRFSATFSIKDLLNAPTTRSYNFSDVEYNYDSYRWGTNYAFSLIYKIG